MSRLRRGWPTVATPDAVERLSRDEWWVSVRSALDALEPAEVDRYQADTQLLEASVADGLRER